jgi:Rrf2 family protein
MTLRGAYSALAVLHLGHYYGDRQCKTREIAEGKNIPLKFLQQILATLVREGLLVSVAGPKGAYSLSRSPEELSLLDVIEAADGSLEPAGCGVCEVECDWDGPCPLRDAWARAREALVDSLASTSFGDLQKTST